jgi:hypothetical protein
MQAQKPETSDTSAIISRKKADAVLSYFDTIQGTKLLYSMRDKDYYVIIQENYCCKEYYVSIDSSGTLNEIRTLQSSKKEKGILLKAFDLNNYHAGLVTRVPDATYVRGEPSYFVIKDENGKRYGEYSLSSLTLPLPINGKLYGYLFRRTIEQASQQKPQ